MAESTVKLKTTGMHCPSCSMLIEMSVGDLDGVAERAQPTTAPARPRSRSIPTKVDTERIIERDPQGRLRRRGRVACGAQRRSVGRASR